MKRFFISFVSLAFFISCGQPLSLPKNPTMVPKFKSAISESSSARKEIPAFNPAKEAPWLKVPLGLDNENLLIPADNPLTPEKAELGRLLYFDKRLSVDGTVSCATCHNPELGWTDQAPVSTGIKGQKGARSAPTVLNSTYMGLQFWDGRAANLGEQALRPQINPIEMGNENHQKCVERIKAISGYLPYFQKAFNQEPTKENIAKAIASFERTVLSGNSRYDRWTFGETTAMNESEIRGRDLFFGKANCTRCHAGPNFSDGMFHNLGVGMDTPKPDEGRFAVTQAKEDRGAFKTPTIRDITRTGPYMHDGSEKTLEEVVEFYNKGGNKNPNLDVRLQPLNLSDQEKSDLVSFMKTLEGNPPPAVEPPAVFPK
jgi:cytochrome c peroxidase